MRDPHQPSQQMQKTVILPEGRTIDADGADEPASAYGTVVDHGDHRRVRFSGSTMPEGDLEEQVRGILTHKERALADLGGSMDDVVTMRLFVREDVLSPAAQARIHAVRQEFFERPHYPASTMVGVASLLQPDALVEIEIEAEIPADDWDVSVLPDE